MVVELTMECMIGSPWKQADIGNVFDPYFKPGDPEHPDGVYVMAIKHFSEDRRLKANGLAPYDGNCDGYLRVFHQDIDPKTNICTICGNPVSKPPEKVPSVTTE